MGDSRQSVATLQTQLEDYRERSRKDMIEAQRNCKDRLVELQRAQITLKAQQEEVRTNGLEDIHYRIKHRTCENKISSIKVSYFLNMKYNSKNFLFKALSMYF